MELEESVARLDETVKSLQNEQRRTEDKSADLRKRQVGMLIRGGEA